MRFGKQLDQQFPRIRDGGKGTQFAEIPVKLIESMGDHIRLFRRVLAAAISKKSFFGIRQTDVREIVRGQIPHRREQGGTKRNILLRVVDKTENIDQRFHFRIIADVDGGGGGDGDSLFRERGNHFRNPTVLFSGQDGNIRILHPPKNSRVRVVISGVALALDDVPYLFRVGGSRCPLFQPALLHRIDAPPVLPLFFLVFGHDMDLHSAAVRRIPAPSFHIRAARIIDVGVLLRHRQNKLRIDSVEDGVGTSEISGESQGICSRRPFERPLLLREKYRFTPPKTVNGLLDIPDEKHALAADCG